MPKRKAKLVMTREYRLGAERGDAGGEAAILGCGAAVAFIVTAIYLIGAAVHWLTSTVETFLNS